MNKDSVDNPLEKPSCKEKKEIGVGVGGGARTVLVIVSIEEPEAGIGRPEYDGAGLGLGGKSHSLYFKVSWEDELSAAVNR